MEPYPNLISIFHVAFFTTEVIAQQRCWFSPPRPITVWRSPSSLKYLVKPKRILSQKLLLTVAYFSLVSTHKSSRLNIFLGECLGLEKAKLPLEEPLEELDPRSLRPGGLRPSLSRSKRYDLKSAH